MSRRLTHEFSDERLVAYVDGEANAADVAEIDRALPHSHDLQMRVAAFRATGRDLSKLFDDVLNAPVPQRLVDTVLNAPQSSSATVIPFTRARAKRSAGMPRLMALAAAACAAFVVVGYGARQIMVPSTTQQAPVALALSSDGVLIAGRDLASVLDLKTSRESLKARVAERDAVLKPLLTFAATDGNVCRKYAVELSANEVFAGVACRQGDTWRIAVHEAVSSGPRASDQVVVAGNSGHERVDGAVDGLRTGDMLSADEEAALIQRQWKIPSH